MSAPRPARPLRAVPPCADAALSELGAVFARLAASLPLSVVSSQLSVVEYVAFDRDDKAVGVVRRQQLTTDNGPLTKRLPTEPDALADALEAEEPDPLGAAVQLGMVAEEFGDWPMRSRAAAAARILRGRGVARKG